MNKDLTFEEYKMNYWHKIDGFTYNPLDTKKEFPFCDLCAESIPYHYLNDCKIDGCFNHKCFATRRLKKKENKSYLWLTLSPDKILRNIDNTPENLQALDNWCSNWFEHFLGYGDYSWVVENGSQGDHLHVHAVLEMKNSHKHAEKIKKSWAKHFPNHQLLTSVDCNSKAYRNGTKRGEYGYKRFDDPLILQERLIYMENEKKGSHENLSDTGVRGSRGFLTDNS